MPRNPAGVYTLPNPPVVSGTVIQSLDENVTRQDVEAELTSSLDRNGRGPMLAPIRVPDGSNAVPTYSFTSETNSGIYRKANGEFWFAVGGVDVFQVTIAGIALAPGKFIDGEVPLTPSDADARYMQIAHEQNIGNRIINGKFAINQRYAAGSVSVSTTNVYGMDRWYGNTIGAGVFAITRSPDATLPGEFNALLNATTADAALAAGDLYSFGQTIEGINIADLNFGSASARSFTLAFEAFTNVAGGGTFPVSFRNNLGNRTYVKTFTIPQNVWTLVSMTIPGETTGTWETGTLAGMLMHFGLGVGSSFNAPAADSWQVGNFFSVAGCTNMLAALSNTLLLRRVRFHAGSIDYGPDRRLFAEELALCERYYEKSFLMSIAPASGVGGNTGEQQYAAISNGAANFHTSSISYRTLKRAVPIVTIYNPSAANSQVRDQSAGLDCSASAAISNGERSFRVDFTGNPGTVIGNVCGFNWTASAEL